MTKTETIKKLQKRYHVHIDRETFYSRLSGAEYEDFKIYTLDGCCWDKVIGYRSLIATLARDKEALAKIYKENHHPWFDPEWTDEEAM